MRQLTGEDYENLLAFRTSLRRFLHWSQTQARAVGLTPAQHQLLLAIKGHRGPDSPAVSDLASYLLLRHHSAVELIDRAETAGFVQRWRDERDGRVTRVTLTPDGEARLIRLTAAHLDELKNLAPVLDQLVHHLSRRAELLDAGAEHVAGVDPPIDSGSRPPTDGGVEAPLGDGTEAPIGSGSRLRGESD
jgi:DNA-binding MarR family transcriptional regulator